MFTARLRRRAHLARSTRRGVRRLLPPPGAASARPQKRAGVAVQGRGRWADWTEPASESRGRAEVGGSEGNSGPALRGPETFRG